VEFFLGPIRIFFETLSPDRRPRPVEHVRYPVLDDLPRCSLSRVSIDRIKRPRTFHPPEAFRAVPALLVVPVPQNPHRLDEGLRLLNHRFPVDADEVSGSIANG